MNKNPLSWTCSDVGVWLSSINCSGAREIFKFHGIDGRDLLQLSDLDLRVDLKFKRIHDRKYLLRRMQELKHDMFAVLEVFYSNDVCRIRIADLETYTFEKLRRDSARFWGLDPEACVLQDQEGFVLGNFPVAPFFDSSNRQQEPVFLIPALPGQEQVDRPQEFRGSEGEEDVNEDRPDTEEVRAPYLEAEKQLLNQKKRPVLSGIQGKLQSLASGMQNLKKLNEETAKEAEAATKSSAQESSRSPENSARNRKPGARSDDEEDLQSVLTLMK